MSRHTHQEEPTEHSMPSLNKIPKKYNVSAKIRKKSCEWEGNARRYQNASHLLCLLFNAMIIQSLCTHIGRQFVHMSTLSLNNLIQHFPIEQRSEREHELLPDSVFNSKHDSGDSISVPNSFCLFVRCCHSTVQF